MVERVRLSIGTAVELGLEMGSSDLYFTTAFLMTYHDNKCESNCAFCPQARDSSSASDRLSRISWPDYDIERVVESMSRARQFKRICVQTLCYESVVDNVVDIVNRLREVSLLPISVAIHPVETNDLIRLKESGVTSIGIAVDASTPSLFEEIKGKKRGTTYRWNRHLEALKEALAIFGTEQVTTHLIIGLGESEKDAADFILQMYGMGIEVGLFAFTSIRGTALEGIDPPLVPSYRRIQVIRHLVSRGALSSRQIKVNDDGSLSLDIGKESLLKALSSGDAFRVTGCKECNRPYYNETPRGPIYNYPRPLTEREISDAIESTRLV